MKKWNQPEVKSLSLEATMSDIEPYGKGDEWICPYCCKTSNIDANGKHSHHKGGCLYFESNDKSVLVRTDSGNYTCKLES